MSARLFAHYFEDPQKNDRADQRNDKAPNAKARQPLPVECIHHKSTDKRTNHADDDIRQQALIFVRTHELGRDPPRETADNDPSQETHLLHAAPLFVNDTSSIAHLSKDKNRLHETVVDKLKNSWWSFTTKFEPNSSKIDPCHHARKSARVRPEKPFDLFSYDLPRLSFWDFVKGVFWSGIVANDNTVALIVLKLNIYGIMG